MMRAHTVILVGAVVVGCGSREPASPDADGVATDPTPCLPLSVAKPGHMVAPTVAEAPVIDGVLDDWKTCFLTLNHDNAGFERGTGIAHGFPSARFSIARHGSSLYVAASVIGVSPLGNDTVDIRHNDNIEVYLDGDGLTMIGYGTDAREIVIDHANRLQGFRTGGASDIGAVNHAVVESDGRYTVELELQPATFGLAEFSSTVGFDFGVSDGDGIGLMTELVWTQQCESTTACSCWWIDDDAPYCDSRQFGRVAFKP